MSKTSVLMIDDEILALEHMKGLVDWNSLGYEIVGAVTNPKKALSMALEYKPQVIIADIRMPIMDGLAFAKQIFHTGLTPHIVLLTSHKEFEYAKEAMKLGISDYWIKHEMSAPSLTQELRRLRQELLSHSEIRSAIRRQLFGELLARRMNDDQQWRTLAGSYADHESLRLISIRRDQPLPIVAEAAITTGEVLLDPTEDAWADGEHDGLSPVCSLTVGDIAVVMVADNGGRSELRQRERLLGTAESLRAVFQRKNGGPASVAVTTAIKNWRTLPDSFAHTSRMLEQSVFTGPRGTHFMKAELQTNRAERWVLEPDMNRVSEAAKANDAEAVAAALSLFFEQAQAGSDLTALTEGCRMLASTLNRVLAESGASPIGRMWIEGLIDPLEWMHLAGIRSWFIGQFNHALIAASESASYSRKIRQAIEYMRENYAEEISTDTIAERLGISKDHLRHLFKEETGQTILDALTQIRITHAKRLLKDGSLKIYEIAERVGFRNSQYFSQVFRKTTGMNPMEYVERQE